MSLTGALLSFVRNVIAGPYLLGLVLFALGLITVKPLLVMAGSVIMCAFMAITLQQVGE